MPSIIIMSGISGSGKSTLANRLYPNAYYLNADSIREELCENASDQTKNRGVFQLLYERFEHIIDLGRDIIVDNTSLTFSDRNKFYKIIQDTDHNRDYCIILIQIKPDIAWAQYRNNLRVRKVPDEVIEKQFQKIEAPTKWERENINVLELSI